MSNNKRALIALEWDCWGRKKRRTTRRSVVFIFVVVLLLKTRKERERREGALLPVVHIHFVFAERERDDERRCFYSEYEYDDCWKEKKVRYHRLHDDAFDYEYRIVLLFAFIQKRRRQSDEIFRTSRTRETRREVTHERRAESENDRTAVSYTHLTLPTKA